MQAKSGGAPAYKHASRKHTIAEDQYFKSLYEIDILEAKLAVLGGGRLAEILKVKVFCAIISIGRWCGSVLSIRIQVVCEAGS